jgi:hypothetical protein
MTKASPARINRRKLGRGRPPKDPRTDPDLLTTEYALALQDPDGWGLSERMAIDFQVAWFEATATPPTKVPRGAKGRPGVLVGYENRKPYRTFKGRNNVLRRKLRHARPEMVAVLKLALRCSDPEVAAKLFAGLLQLTAVADPKPAIAELLKAGKSDRVA